VPPVTSCSIDPSRRLRHPGGTLTDVVEFRLLGPVEVVSEGRRVAVGGVRDLSLVAALLLDANRVVPVDRLVASAWGADPPASARTVVRNRVSVVRRLISPRDGAGLIETRGSGYVLNVDDDQLDARRFDRLVTRADGLAAGGESGGAAQMLAEALRLWRGPALDGLHTPSLVGAAQRLEEARARALERRVELELAVGRHREVLPELSALTQAYPFRERLLEYLMLALYRAGRQSEALELYRHTRALLTDQLGVEPGPALQRLHEAILRGDVELAGPRPPPAAVGAAAPQVPRQIPLQGFGFTGRGREIAWLDELLRAGDGVGVLAGSAGVGKTALAVHWAHGVSDRFPDGQLYLDLRGYACEQPMPPIEALAQMLRALGVPPGGVPVEVAEAAALYRSRLAGRRLLVLLDNAGSAEQVRPLLPGVAGCLVLVTSRDRLGGLVAREGAHRLALDVLPAVEARALLARMLGADRAEADGAAIDDLARVCAYLPLALRIAAANLTDPSCDIAEYVNELVAGDRLAALEVDGEAAVRAAFDLSYRSVPPAGQQLFRLLGVVPGPDFTVDAAAALADGDREDVARVLRILAGAHLVHRHRPDRYTFHDLLRDYARERVDPDEAAAARVRLFEWYTHGADRAGQLLHPQVLRPPTPASGASGPGPFPADRDRALAWLRAEAPNLVAACLVGGDLGLHPQTSRLAYFLRGYAMLHWDRATAQSVCEAGLRSAVAEGDLRGQVVLHWALANAAHSQARYPEAMTDLRRGLRLGRAAGWRHGEIQSYVNLGVVCGEIGQLKRALAEVSRALRISREIGYDRGVVTALVNLGTVQAGLGRLPLAERTLRAAVDACREGDWHASAGAALDSLGGVVRDLGRLDEALDQLAVAMALAQATGSRYAHSASTAKLATVHALAGRHEEARRYAEEAVRCAQGFGARLRQADAINALGMAHAVGGDHRDAVDCHRDAVRLADGTTGRQYVEALIGLATAYADLGRWPDAQRPALRAAEIAAATGQAALEGWALAVLARIQLGLGTPAAAGEYARRALTRHRATGYRIGEARALVVLGDAASSPDAREHWRAGLALLTEIGMVPEADEVHARLAG
jgi:DNA-binding SARP family transcriptional activator